MLRKEILLIRLFMEENYCVYWLVELQELTHPNVTKPIVRFYGIMWYHSIGGIFFRQQCNCQEVSLMTKELNKEFGTDHLVLIFKQTKILIN
jgi:hypothetical protein